MKQLLDFKIKNIKHISRDTVLMKVMPAEGNLPEIKGGQFVNILVPATKGVFLRRPISVCNVEDGALWLYIKNLGRGTNTLCSMKEDETLNILVPLGNGFSSPDKEHARILLVGGGVGIAPLLYWGKTMAEKGHEVSFILGGASKDDISLADDFKKYGSVSCTTVDGSIGTKGFVTDCEMINLHYDMIYCCGPTPMMKAVSAKAKLTGSPIEISLENKMACGLGACLCCVEENKEGHNVCVCSEGPVFNPSDLNW